MPAADVAGYSRALDPGGTTMPRITAPTRLPRACAREGRLTWTPRPGLHGRGASTKRLEGRPWA